MKAVFTRRENRQLAIAAILGALVRFVPARAVTAVFFDISQTSQFVASAGGSAAV